MQTYASVLPQDAADLRRLVAHLERLAAADPTKAPACRELLIKLTVYLPERQPAARRAA
jgi:DNA-binding SARP family transcriptional activator